MRVLEVVVRVGERTVVCDGHGVGACHVGWRAEIVGWKVGARGGVCLYGAWSRLVSVIFVGSNRQGR